MGSMATRKPCLMAKLPISLLAVMLPLYAVTIGDRRLTTSASALPSLSDPHPVNAQEAILNAFDKYRIVALGEAHALQEEHDFIQSLIRNPAFADKVNDVVVECGNALYQNILDRYIAGQDVPLAEVRQVWRK